MLTSLKHHGCFFNPIDFISSDLRKLSCCYITTLLEKIKMSYQRGTSEELMKEYILEHLGTKYVTGRSLSVRVSTDAAPDFTTAKAEGSEHCQGNSYSNVCKNKTESLLDAID